MSTTAELPLITVHPPKTSGVLYERPAPVQSRDEPIFASMVRDWGYNPSDRLELDLVMQVEVTRTGAIAVITDLAPGSGPVGLL